jgi:plasmid stabilization system protein ParE
MTKKQVLPKEPLVHMDSLSETVPLTMMISPFCDPQKAMTEFLATAAIPGAKLRTLIYGCTWEPFFHGIAEAKKAGADVKAIFDHTQAAGPKEAQRLEWLMGQGFEPGLDFLIGTSPVQHQIVHLKRTAIWTPDGKARVEFGSWNYSDSASKQLNDVTIVESAHVASYTELAFDNLWHWIDLHEKAMQLHRK